MAADLLQLHSPSLHGPHHPYDRIFLPVITFQPSQQLPFSLPNLHSPTNPIPSSPLPGKPHDRRLKITAAHFNISFPPLISSYDHWGIWTSLFTAGAFGLWPEKTKVRSALRGALVSTLVALAMTNLSNIASEVPVYCVVFKYLLPVAVHLLLFRTDLRCILQSIGTLLLVFLLGSGNCICFFLC